MSKAVLLSIHPNYCELIAKGEKVVEVRKQKPKIETPFKVYIYMTAGSASYPVNIGGVPMICHNNGGQTVIGEFECDEIIELAPLNRADEDIEKQACLSREQIVKYLRGKGYGWHISNLVIYDMPKELSEFKKAGFLTEENWLAALYPNTHCHYEAWAKRFDIIKPPQSYCFVEELQK